VEVRLGRQARARPTVITANVLGLLKIVNLETHEKPNEIRCAISSIRKLKQC
jgi:hypothetical protein